MLTLQYIPHQEIVSLTTQEKIKKILKSVKEDKIILIEGRLAPLEESELIKSTMEQIDKKFKGIEICSVDYEEKEEDTFESMKKAVAHFLLNKKSGVTIVGPASIVKEIKKDPNKIELLTQENIKKKRR
jgi:hypothetical protein